MSEEKDDKGMRRLLEDNSIHVEGTPNSEDDGTNDGSESVVASEIEEEDVDEENDNKESDETGEVETSAPDSDGVNSDTDDTSSDSEESEDDEPTRSGTQRKFDSVKKLGRNRGKYMRDTTRYT